MTSKNIDDIKQNIIQLLEDEAQIQNWKANTIIAYRNALFSYCKFHNQTLNELIQEAEDDEEQYNRLKHRKIKQRLIQWKQHLQNNGNSPHTINSYLLRVKSYYHLQEIQLPHIKQVINNNHETIHDIPTKKHIKKALENTNNVQLQAIILFASSSGCSRNELKHLTIQDFITATQEYHKETELEHAIPRLEQIELVIPTFHLTRLKTNYPYYCFCSNEAVQKIIQYLKERMKQEPLKKTDLLFKMKTTSITHSFRRLNDKLGWGYVGNYRFFHIHALRKFFAIQLLKADLDSMTINFLSGRRIDPTQEAYFKADPAKLKNKYMHVVDALTISEDVRFLDVTSKERRELELLRRRTREQEGRLKAIENLIDNLQFQP